MKKIFCAVICVLLIGTAAFAEDALVIPAQTLRLSVNWIPTFVFRFQEWENVPTEKAMFLNTGFGAEYGVADWFNIQALWLPGINWGRSIGGEPGNYHDLFAGTKAAILGRDALFGNSLNMLLSAALGINIPLTSILEPKGTDALETDTLLWGSVLRIYYDMMFASWFTLNACAEAIYYPRQISANTVYGDGMIEHLFDLSGELEPRFQYVMKNSDIFKFGLPLRFFYAPFQNMAHNDADVFQYCFTVSGYIGIASTRTLGPPFRAAEVYLRYDAAVLGENVDPLHRLGITVKVLLGKEEKAQ